MVLAWCHFGDECAVLQLKKVGMQAKRVLDAADKTASACVVFFDDVFLHSNRFFLFLHKEQPECIRPAVAGNRRADGEWDDLLEIVQRFNLRNQVVQQRFLLNRVRNHNDFRVHLFVLGERGFDELL
ncbi:hypothetical protein SDC9_168228 [bioreactor metagenome]|uniref:Uncharacterized protein n=1 Tax=bioreactor metagenome TaxID=1076179 RepID=A0A645G4Y3_9ZZZZ